MLSRAIDKEFEEADDTGVLDISGRNLRQFPVIPGDLVDFKLIFEADLSKNRFDKVPKEVVSFKALVKLNCHHNSIRWLPEELYLLVNLKEIDFSRNFLQKFPGEICSMNLHAINLSNNRLISLPNDIGKLKTVQFLDLSCNQLPELPESFYTLKTLRHLGLHRNCLRDLSEDLCQMTELQYLDVSSNNLCRVPISLRHIRSLQIFSADDNPLESPPPQICSRGLVHLCKYLERQEKSGSDLSLYGPNSRDDTLRRRERTYKRLSNMHKSSAETTPVPNGDDREMGLLDEMASLVNKTFGEKDGEHTPTGSLHWSIAQFVTPDKPSSAGSGGGGGKEDYREAAYRLYLQQEGNKARNKHGNRPSSPAGSSSLNETSTSSPTGSLPKLKSDENVYRTTSGELANSRSLSYAGRSLSNEKFPRSGSWNSHMRITSPVLPSKYVTPDKISEDKAQSRRRSIPCGNDSPTLSTSSNSTVDALPSSTSSSAETTPTRQRSSPVLSSTPIIPAGSSSSTNSSNSSSSSSSSKSNDAKSSKSSKRRPPPLDTSSHSHSTSQALSPRSMQLPNNSSHETSV